MPRSIKGDWITAYLKYTEDTEAPRSYHTWTAISCIAGALARKVYFEFGSDKKYPNFYVILVGPSGKVRKGLAMGIGEDIFKQLNLELAAEAVTREALLIRMNKAKKNYLNPDGSQGVHSSITLFSKEFATLTGVKNVKFLADLTDWYDSHEIWTNDTKNKGTDKIEGMFLNILAAVAPDWLPQILPLEAVGGGFTSRCVFIVATDKEKIIALPPPRDAKLRLALIEDLKDIRGITGNFVFDDDATKAYAEWYTTAERKKQEGIYPIEDPRFNSYCERRATHMMKLSMIVCAAHGNDRIITVDMFKQALSYLEEAESKMTDVFGGVGLNELAQKTNMLLQHLRKHKRVSRQDVLTKFYRDISWSDLLDIEQTMSAMGVVRIENLVWKGVQGTVYTYVG